MLVLRDQEDALRVYAAARKGKLTLLDSPLTENEMLPIKHGDIYVWRKEDEGIKVWKDNKKWYVPRILPTIDDTQALNPCVGGSGEIVDFGSSYGFGVGLTVPICYRIHHSLGVCIDESDEDGKYVSFLSGQLMIRDLNANHPGRLEVLKPSENM